MDHPAAVSNDHKDDLRSLAIFAMIVVFMTMAAVLWCLFSTCLGPPLMQFLSARWDRALDNAYAQRVQRPARAGWGSERYRDYQELDQFEMEGPRRNRMG